MALMLEDGKIYVLEYVGDSGSKQIIMAYKDFANDYKSGEIGSAVVLYGAEDFLMNWAVEKIAADNVDEEYRNIDYRVLNGEETGAYDILSEARAYSMFSPKRVVVIKNYLPMFRKTADAGMEELADYVTGLSGNADESPAILVFVIESDKSPNITSYGKQIIKNCRSYEMGKLEKPDLSAFITKRVRSKGKIISSRELHHIIDISGYFNRGSTYSLTQLDSDLEKLTGASGSDTIESSLIDEIMMGEGDKFVFDLVDALVAGKKGRALEIAETIIREEDGSMAVLALLGKQFEIMYDSLELTDKGMSMAQMAKATGVNEYRFKKAYTAAMRYSTEKIKSLLVYLYNLDRDIKSGDIDKDAALELFVVKAAR